MNILKRLNWTNTLFLILTPIFALVGSILLISFDAFQWLTVCFAVIYLIASSLAITAGYHRLFSHRSYRAVWPVRLLLLLLGSATFEGSAVEWCTDHRRHHLYADTEKDPYNIRRGFWYAHMGWLFMLDPSRRDLSNVQDLMADPLLRWQHRFFTPIAIFMGFILPMGIAALWGDAWGGLIIAGALRITLTQQMTFCINSVCHTFGKTTYSEKQSAKDNWITALFTFGEGFHNFHHQFAIDYRNGIRAYHFDPSKWVIRGMFFLGLAKDLKRVSQEQIIRYRVECQEKQLRQLAEKNVQAIEGQQIYPIMYSLYTRILQVVAHIEQLKKDYTALKKEKLQHCQRGMQRYRRYLAAYKSRIRKTKAELNDALSMWSKMIRNYA